MVKSCEGFSSCGGILEIDVNVLVGLLEEESGAGKDKNNMQSSVHGAKIKPILPWIPN